jgi:hypothetical protein
MTEAQAAELLVTLASIQSGVRVLCFMVGVITGYTLGRMLIAFAR